MQAPGGAYQRPGHSQRHAAHLQDHARLCQVEYLNIWLKFGKFVQILLVNNRSPLLSCSALTLEDEKRSLSLLINGFIRMVRADTDNLTNPNPNDPAPQTVFDERED